MKKAHIVTDLGFGDSGKGVIADRIAANLRSSAFASGGDVLGDRIAVIRHTGGSQAGHTVDLNSPGETDPTKRHIHSSFAAGALGGFYSHMSHYCPIYPQNLIREGLLLEQKRSGFDRQRASIDPLAPMVTVYDVAWNRIHQDGHNTVGIGIGATMERMLHSEIRTFMGDLMHENILAHKLQRVLRYYEIKLAGLPTYKRDEFMEVVSLETEAPLYARHFFHFQPTQEVIRNYDEIIFEGAQGVMLDQDHGFIPHVTWGYTTSRNAVEMISQTGGNVGVQVHHVTRAYQTRHGDGPMTSARMINVPDDPTNVTNLYQGEFRTGTLDVSLLAYAFDIDKSYLARLPGTCHMYPNQLHITCCDHLDAVELGQLVDRIDAQLLWPLLNCWHRATRKQPRVA